MSSRGPPPSSQKSMKTPNTTQDGNVPDQQAPEVSNQQLEEVRKALSGLGVDQKEISKVIPTMVMFPTLWKWSDEQKKYFNLEKLEHESLRFVRAAELWLNLQSNRDKSDAMLINDVLSPNGLKKSYNLVIEIACTRSPDEFSRVQSAYKDLFKHSIAEDIYPQATLEEIENDPRCKDHIFDRKLVFALVSNCRGPMVDENTAKSEAEILRKCFKRSNPMEEEVVVRILSTRSKEHLKSLFNHYRAKYLPGSRKTIDADLDVSAPESLKQAVQCLSAPRTYFIKVLDAIMKPGATEDPTEGFIWVMTTCGAADVAKIPEEYQTLCGRSLFEDIDRIAKGNFKDFLLALLRRGPIQLKNQ